MYFTMQKKTFLFSQVKKGGIESPPPPLKTGQIQAPTKTKVTNISY